MMFIFLIPTREQLEEFQTTTSPSQKTESSASEHNSDSKSYQNVIKRDSSPSGRE